jgi:predicted transcriptional regulator
MAISPSVNGMPKQTNTAGFPKLNPPHRLPLPALLSQVLVPSLLSRALLWFAIEFEQTSEVSLAISANVLRLLTDEGIPLTGLPRMAALSKEAIAMSLSFLVKRGFAAMHSKPGGNRVKVVLLTPKGSQAQKTYDL